MSAEFLAHALKARRSGSAWMAPCPAHEDRNPSLSIREFDGKVLLHCHAGCAQRDVIEALKARGLWESRTTMESRRRIVAEYSYTDEAGNLLYQVVRFEPKDFRPRYPDGRGGWIWKKHPHQVLYHLPEVLEAPIVFLPEGEKDCESLRSRGFVATTCAGGAKASWLPEFTEVLRGREVIILPDADVPGRQRALTIARALLRNVERLVVLELEGAKDVSEWFGHGHSEVELIAQLDGRGVAK
jgi:DNA primase